MSSPQPYFVPESSKLPFAMAVTMLVLIIGASTTVKPELGPFGDNSYFCLLYTSPSPRDQRGSRMPSSA